MRCSPPTRHRRPVVINQLGCPCTPSKPTPHDFAYHPGLRGALENLALAAGFAVRQDMARFEQWQAGTHEPHFGNARDFLADSQQAKALWQSLGQDVLFTKGTGILDRIWRELSEYVHSNPDATNGAIWQSSGPIWAHEGLQLVADGYMETMAMGYMLLCIGQDGFVVPERAWPLFDRGESVWSDVPVDALRQVFG